MRQTKIPPIRPDGNIMTELTDMWMDHLSFLLVMQLPRLTKYRLERTGISNLYW